MTRSLPAGRHTSLRTAPAMKPFVTPTCSPPWRKSSAASYKTTPGKTVIAFCLFAWEGTASSRPRGHGAAFCQWNFRHPPGRLSIDRWIGFRRFQPAYADRTETARAQGQFYNLDKDIRQEHDVYLQRPQFVDRLHSLLKKYQAQGFSRPIKRLETSNAGRNPIKENNHATT